MKDKNTFSERQPTVEKAVEDSVSAEILVDPAVFKRRRRIGISTPFAKGSKRYNIVGQRRNTGGAPLFWKAVKDRDRNTCRKGQPTVATKPLRSPSAPKLLSHTIFFYYYEREG